MLRSKMRLSLVYAGFCLLPISCSNPRSSEEPQESPHIVDTGSKSIPQREAEEGTEKEDTPLAAEIQDPFPASDLAASVPETSPPPPTLDPTPSPPTAIISDTPSDSLSPSDPIDIPSPLAAPIDLIQPEPLTLAAAMNNLNALRSGSPTFDSTKMGDAGKKFRLGDGYDVLNGLRSPSCLDPEGLDIQTQPLYETIDSYEVVRSNLDFYKKMQTEFGTEIGGAWKLFSGSLSFKTKMLKETQIQSDDLAVMAGFSYLKEKVSLYKAWAEFAPYFKEAYQRSPVLFRRHCGDRYTQDVTMGAGLYLVVKAEKIDSTQYDKLEVETAVQLGISNIITIGKTYANVSNEQKQILKSYRFTAKCYSTGSSADVCAAYNLNTQLDPLADAASMQKRVNEARARIVEEVNQGAHLVVMQETLRDYEVPFESCTGSFDQPCPDRWKAFYDYRPRSDKAGSLLERRFEAEEVCSAISYWPRRCNQVLKSMQNAILNCLSLNESCSEPNRDELNRILDARHPGKIQIWQDAGRKGRFFEIDFSQRDLRPHQFHTLNSLGWNWLNDRASSLQTLLAPGWKLRVYEHMNENNAGQYRDLDSNRYYGNLGFDLDKFNDKLSAFRLMPPADLP